MAYKTKKTSSRKEYLTELQSNVNNNSVNIPGSSHFHS